VHDDYIGAESQVLSRAMWGDRQCDVVFALFEDLEGFGTLAEVSSASAEMFGGQRSASIGPGGDDEQSQERY
jgi:hypothetical protein